MSHKHTHPFSTEADARKVAESIKSSADPLTNPVSNVHVAQVYGTEQWVVTYYRGSLD